MAVTEQQAEIWNLQTKLATALCELAAVTRERNRLRQEAQLGKLYASLAENRQLLTAFATWIANRHAPEDYSADLIADAPEIIEAFERAHYPCAAGFSEAKRSDPNDSVVA